MSDRTNIYSSFLLLLLFVFLSVKRAAILYLKISCSAAEYIVSPLDGTTSNQIGRSAGSIKKKKKRDLFLRHLKHYKNRLQLNIETIRLICNNPICPVNFSLNKNKLFRMDQVVISFLNTHRQIHRVSLLQ